ncbi:MAG: hypothetical protein ABI690_03845 [Chloroflexota bacterium]
MSRFWLRLALPLMIGFTVYIFLIHTQLNNDSDLQAFFMPSDSCPAPCFMGVQPGVTPAADAIAMLQSDPWIKSVASRYNPSVKEGRLVLTWSGTQPTIINTEAESAFHICGNLVCSITIATNIELGAVLLAFGQPDSATLRSFPDNGHTLVLQTSTYDLLKFNIRATAYCPPVLTAMALQHSLTNLQIGTARDQILPSARVSRARYQIVTFQKRTYPWLLRRAFVCTP